MRYALLHESPGRLRVRPGRKGMTAEEADILDSFLASKPYVTKIKIFEHSGSVSIRYKTEEGARDRLLQDLLDFSFFDEDIRALVPEQNGRMINRQYRARLISLVAGRLFRRIFFPMPLDRAWTLMRSLGYIRRGAKILLKGKLEVPVLDAVAITASMLTGDFATAGSVMFLLDIGELLEEWTHKRSVDDLARTLSLKVDRVWLRNKNSEDLPVDLSDVEIGDHIIIRTSDVVPLDGKVVSGACTVNQASMTGESVPVPKEEGGYVYAGTVVEEGDCVIEVTKASGSGKYDQIVRMIEESEKLKSNTEAKAFHLADSLVPYSLVGAALTFLLTRSVTRAMSFLMVDFSCALKLAMPLSVLSAIKEADENDIRVKGGKFLEAISEADTIVFDKTGTLTRECPTVVDIVTFGDAGKTESLRIAACLEEHYPHSMANAVVKYAEEQGVLHDEMHTSVEYVVAHGISSMIDDKRAVIGSYHFIFEDEQSKVPEDEQDKLDSLPAEYTHLYLAIDGVLQAAVCITDPLREESAEVIEKLHGLGFKRVCMMTGDNDRTAAAIAAKLNLDEYHSEVMPEDKAEFIKKEHEAGRKVVMIGDGVNDTPALSEADAGIAIRSGAAIANEVSDITISSEDLRQLLILKELSNRLMSRINRNYRFIISFNAALIGLGVAGILPPASSALLHNTSTVVSGLYSMTKLLPGE
ncbi:MAG: heavy metal translocating P-type ATPase [Firmicutes bacterium]|nr:heavy metal translocating P-type ATPase [Bacillota bacterium]